MRDSEANEEMLRNADPCRRVIASILPWVLPQTKQPRTIDIGNVYQRREEQCVSLTSPLGA